MKLYKKSFLSSSCLLVLLPIADPIPIKRLIQILHVAREPFGASVDAARALASDCLAALTAQLELLLDKVIAADQLLGIALPLLLNLHEAGVILMWLAAELLEALGLLLKVGEGVEVVQPQELVADLFEYVEVGRSVGAHYLICINYGVRSKIIHI